VKHFKIFFLALLISLPSMVFATSVFETQIVRPLGNLVNIATPAVLALAVLYFFWNTVGLIRSDDEAGMQKAKSAIIWGVIVLFVLVALSSIIGIMAKTFDIDDSRNTPLPLPYLPTS
jgi:hypothetical protein